MANQKFHCTECGNHTAAETLGRATDRHWHYMDEEDPNSAMSHDEYYEVVKCVTCSAVHLYGYDELHEDGLDEAAHLYPTKRSIPGGIPDVIAREFYEAQKVEKISRAAYAVLIGRVLERLFKDKGAQGKDLYDQIKDLSAKNIIPEMLCEMGHTLRFLRNKGAHATDYEIEEGEVEAMKEFVITMLEYVYVAPAKLATLQATIERKKSGLPKKPVKK